MTKLRMLFLGASVVVLGACGGTADDATTTAAAPPPVTASATPAAAPSEATAGADDKKICTDINEAGEAMKKELVTVLTESEFEPDPEQYATILENFAAAISKAAGDGDSAVVTAANVVVDENKKAAAAADPTEAAAAGSYEKAFEDLAAACGEVGVKIPV